MALLTTAHPDLILVDVNGQTLGLLDAVRSGEGVAGRVDPDTPLIVLSRDADRLQRIRVLERGGDDIVGKPFAYPELRARIAAVLRRLELRGRTRIGRTAGAQRFATDASFALQSGTAPIKCSSGQRDQR